MPPHPGITKFKKVNWLKCALKAKILFISYLYKKPTGGRGRLGGRSRMFLTIGAGASKKESQL